MRHPTPDLTGKWRNQHGSELDLVPQAGEKLSGVFRSGVGAVDPGQAFQVEGFQSGDLVTFCISFGSYGVAAWVGQHTVEAGLERLSTLWHLAENIVEEYEPTWLWYGIKAGADEFRRV